MFVGRVNAIKEFVHDDLYSKRTGWCPVLESEIKNIVLLGLSLFQTSVIILLQVLYEDHYCKFSESNRPAKSDGKV